MSTNEIMPKLKDFLCENLGIDADVLEFDTQLFGDGEIGLDSIDSLEIIAYVDEIRCSDDRCWQRTLLQH